MLVAHLTSFDTPSLLFAVGIGFIAGCAATLLATRAMARREVESKA